MDVNKTIGNKQQSPSKNWMNKPQQNNNGEAFTPKYVAAGRRGDKQHYSTINIDPRA